MFPAILSKTWWRSFVKTDADGEKDAEGGAGPGEGEELDELDEERELSADGTESDSDEEGGEDEFDEDPFQDEPEPRKVLRNKVDSPKDFFSTELVYRFDILPDTDQHDLRGSYRVEVKGNKGGIWTLIVNEQLEVINRREEAEVVLSLQQRDFMQLVNGDLNPQMAIMAQKIRLSGDVRRGVLFQNLLAPPAQE